MAGMSPQDSPGEGRESTGMEIPQAIVAQATAAAISNAAEEPPAHSRPTIATPDSSAAGTPTDDRAADRVPTQEARSKDHLESPIEQRPPPAFSSQYGQVDLDQDGFDTKAKVANDGRVNIKINQRSRRLSTLLANLQHAEAPVQPPSEIPPFLTGAPGEARPPPLNVVIHVVGSRGDVQPFIALGKVLKQDYGHRVRLATHDTFRGFVEENGLEYFNIGGDPAELMAFMVKNPGLMPGMDSLKSGDVGKRRKGMYEIVQGCWRSCIEIGDGTGMSASDDHLDSRASFDSAISMTSDPSAKPFVADAIIANPPSFAHVHCAEKLGIPLHLMFTMPWSPTQAFPHPLANIQSSNADTSITNFMTYALVEMMTWQGLGDVINRFRERTLGLEPVSLMWAPGMASRLRIPYTYCWSPALIPKPKDWGPHIAISGFYFLSLASTFTPAPDLMAFLDAGPPPVYIGFGSIVVDDPNAMTKLIFEAVKKSGQRALVSKGWGGFGADAMGIPEGVFMLGNVPHDWLFKHVSCVVHHGGAGTTAAGIALGKPTVVVPFFGDQPFWGAMVAKAGAGPPPIPSKHLTADKLAHGILEALKPTTLQRAQELGARISSEKGSEVGAQTFHDKLNVESLRCVLCPGRAAAWRVKRTTIRLSPFAVTTLAQEGLLDFNDLKLYRPREYDTEDGPWDPISGGASALLGTLGSLMMGFADLPVEILRAVIVKQPETSSKEGTTSTPTEETLKSPSSRLSHEPSKQSVKSTDDTVEITSPVKLTKTKSDLKSPVDDEVLDPAISKTKSSIGSSMASALRGSLSKPSSRSSSPNRVSHHRSNSGSRASHISLEAKLVAGKSIGRMVEAGLKSPMDFTLGLARGFHNAPKLYGDESVRQSEKITDARTGLKVAGKEFGYGFYDGISGLVTQPLEGAKKEGIAGLLKGFGKGVGGVVLKPGAAIWGLPGYTFKGLYKELQKHLGSSTQNYIIAARTAQGFEDWKASTREERRDVVVRWREIQTVIAKEKNLAHHGSFQSPSGFLKARCDDKREKKVQKGKKDGIQRASTDLPGVTASKTRSQDLWNASPDSQEFEEAIEASVAATSRGNPEEDRAIERAIRASVLELKKAANEGKDDAMTRAIQASVAEARHHDLDTTHIDGTGHDDAALEQALQRSLHEHGSSDRTSALADVDFDDSGVDTDDDENIKAALTLSKSEGSTKPPADDEELAKALKLSLQER